MDNEYEVVVTDTELQRCLTYLMKSETPEDGSKPQTMKEIAESFGIQRQTLYTWIKRWKDTGIMDEARRIYLEPKAAAIDRAIDDAINAWPDIIRQQIKVAQGGTEKGSLAAAMWLHQVIVEGAIKRYVTPSSSQEKTYLSSPKNYDVSEV